jgi:hypothetical protein
MNGDTGKTIDYAAMVYKLLGTDRSKPEDGYVFSNGRRFKNTDDQQGGPYGGDESE